MKAVRVYVDGVTVGKRLRNVDQSRVDVIAESMRTIGLQHPISVWLEPDENGVNDVHLIAGLHRLRAAEKLGWEQIDAIEVGLDDIDRKRWEIAENLHRSELTALEHDRHVKEWIRLTEESSKRQVAENSEPAISKRGRKGEGRPKSAVREAARELGIEERAVDRAIKVNEGRDSERARAQKVVKRGADQVLGDLRAQRVVGLLAQFGLRSAECAELLRSLASWYSPSAAACGVCDKPLEAKRRTRRFCSSACRKVAHRRR